MVKRFLPFVLVIGIYGFAQTKNSETTLRNYAKKHHLKNELAEKNAQNFLNSHTWKISNQDELFLGIIDGIPVIISPDDAGQALSTNVDNLHNNTLPGVAVTGLNQYIYMWDSGRIFDTHQEFDSRVTNLEESTVAISAHSTNVAGILMAKGVVPNAIGMAYDANLKSYRYLDIYTKLAEEALNNPDEFVVSNHSYGYQAGWRYSNYGQGNAWYWFGYPWVNETKSSLYGFYSTYDQSYDEFAYDYPNHLIVKSVGNDRNLGPNAGSTHWVYDEAYNWVSSNVSRPKGCAETGYDCIPYSSNAKNILVVGGTNKLTQRYTQASDVVLYESSSLGPTDDGRIKPDLVAPAYNIYTATSTNATAYLTGSGTSYSTPVVTGAISLLQQLYKEKNDEIMPSFLVKGLLTGTTNEAGTSEGPDYTFGWGLLDAQKAAEVIVSDGVDNKIILDEITNNGLGKTYHIQVVDETKPLKVILSWVDPKGTPVATAEQEIALNNRTPMLVNDLDLRITKDTESYMPWKLDPENPANPAITGDNVVDNIEQIWVDNAQGIYDLVVSNKLELKDNDGNIADSQMYSLVIINAALVELAQSNVTINNVNVYPNPTSDFINITLDKGIKDSDIKLFSVDGKLVETKKIADLKSYQLNIANLPKGVYYLHIKGEKTNVTKKIIKK